MSFLLKTCRSATFAIVLGALSSSGCTSAPQPAPDGGSGLPAADGRLAEVPDPLSPDNPTYRLATVAAPAPGQTLEDARFGTAQTRVVGSEGLRHEYSRHDPFNSDASLVLLLHIASGEWRVYRTSAMPYDQSANLVRSIALAEPRWDPANPALLWGLDGFRIVTVNVASGGTTVVKDFAGDPVVAPLLAANPDLYRVTTRDEGEPSQDFRYWALLLQGTAEDYRARFLLTWDRLADQVLAVRPLTAAESRIDWVGVSPGGTWTLVAGDWDNAAPLTGLTLANHQLTQFHRLDYGVAHSDVGLDVAGREVLVMQNTQTDYIDLIPLDPATQPILAAGGSYEGAGRTPLVRLFYDSSERGLNSGVHISCNAPGWCVVSTFTEPNLREQNWLDRTILLVRLDPARPRAFYLAKVHGTAAAYWEETHASITRDGSRVVWATNWGRNPGQERVWLMQLEVNPAWLNPPPE